MLMKILKELETATHNLSEKLENSKAKKEMIAKFNSNEYGVYHAHCLAQEGYAIVIDGNKVIDIVKEDK